MAKREYGIPVIKEEAFAADEYVAACWEVLCDRGVNGYVESPGVSHGKQPSGTGCANQKNQVIKVDDNGNVSMVEENTWNQGDLPCRITNYNWEKDVTLDASVVQKDMNIYWTTHATDGTNRTWHHRGRVRGTNNHS